MDFVLLINQFSSLPVYITGIYFLAKYRGLTKELRIFSIFVFISSVVQSISTILWFQSIPNLPLLHVYVPAGFVALVLFYEAVLDGFIDKKIMRGIMIAFLIFTMINSIFIQPVMTFNSYALMAESILVVILALTTYLVMMDDVARRKRQELSLSLHWINSGLFIYYSSCLAIFYYQSFLDSDRMFRFFSRDFNLQTWMLHAVVLLVMNFCFFLGLWKRPVYPKGDAMFTKHHAIPNE